MNINKKIEQIRQQPEHVRLRWVWGSVIASMVIIVIIWLMSIQTMFSKNQDDTPPPVKFEELTKKFQDAKEAIPQISEELNRIPVSEVIEETEGQNYLTEDLTQENQTDGLNY